MEKKICYACTVTYKRKSKKRSSSKIDLASSLSSTSLPSSSTTAPSILDPVDETTDFTRSVPNHTQSSMTKESFPEISLFSNHNSSTHSPPLSPNPRNKLSDPFSDGKKKEKRKRISSHKTSNSIFTDGKRKKLSSKKRPNPPSLSMEEDITNQILDLRTIMTQNEELKKQLEDEKQKTKGLMAKVVEARSQADENEKKWKDAKRLLIEKDKELSALTGQLVEAEGLYKGKMDSQKEDYQNQLVAANKKIKECTLRLDIYEPGRQRELDPLKLLTMEQEKEAELEKELELSTPKVKKEKNKTYTKWEIIRSRRY